MVKLSLIKDFDTDSSYWDLDEIVLVTLQISEEAADSFGEGIIPEELYIITSDLDRIFLSRNPDATPETDADYIIRTWDIHCEDDSEYITINWTFHVMGEASDLSGTSSHEQCDGRSDIRLDGFAKFRLAIYNGITDIHIPEGVTEIGDEAFYGCTGLKEIHIPESVTEIGNLAFSGCTGLGEIHIPEGVSQIGTGAFDCCNRLSIITVSPDNKTYDSRDNSNAIIHTESNSLIAGCMSTVIPESVTEIGNGAFYGCTGLPEIHIPESVTEIGAEAFYGCTSLKEIHIPGSISEIGNGAFYGCTRLAEIHIPEGVTEIGDKTFEGCTGLTEIQIPDSVTIIGNRAFGGCTRLAEIHIPEGVTEIGDNTFEGCTGLTEIQIPDSVTIISNWAFGGCTRLAEIHIPEGVTEIGICAFKGCTGLTEIQIPDSITKIGNWAFGGCTRLAEINIPEGVTEIGSGAFEDCTGLTVIHIPEGVTNIGYDTFKGCSSLKEIHASRIVYGMGSSPVSGCSGLEIIIPEGVIEISDNAFNNCPELSIIYIPSGVRIIGSGAFRGCTGLKEIHIPESVTEIGICAFEGCSGLTEIHIPESVTEIGICAFKGCSGLTEIHIPDGVSIIHASTFCDCSELSTIHIPNSVTEIENWAFNGCSKLAEIYIPESVSRIGDRAFGDCTSLTEIHIPERVMRIGCEVFRGCSGLEFHEEVDSIQKLGAQMFHQSIASSVIVWDQEGNPIVSDGQSYQLLSSISSDAAKKVIDNYFAKTRTDNMPSSVFILIRNAFYTVWNDLEKNLTEVVSQFKVLYDKCGIEEPDDEIKALTVIRDHFDSINKRTSSNRYTLDWYVNKYVSEKFRHEWYKNYIGTKRLSFDGPTNYREEGIISDEDISNMMCGSWDDFLRYRLIVGHTERQDRFTTFMRDYPLEILNWLGEDTIPYYFYEGLAKGGDYELNGCSKEEFLDILSDKDAYEHDEPVEYAAVLEEKYGIDYAVDYLDAVDWEVYFVELSKGSADFIVQMFSKAVSLGDNAEALKAMGYLSINRDDGKLCLDFSIEMYSRLAAMWKKGLINDDWLTDVDCYGGLAYVFDWEWGELWDEDSYPESPDEDARRLWLLKLLESDFANDIADYLKPLLEQVLERERDYNWENGKKAIESFLAKTSNK